MPTFCITFVLLFIYVLSSYIKNETLNALRQLVRYLIKVLREDRSVVINILHKHGQIRLTLLLGVRGGDGQRVPCSLFKVQRGGQGHSSSIAVYSKPPLRVRIQNKGIRKSGPRIHIVPCDLGDHSANQSIYG